MCLHVWYRINRRREVEEGAWRYKDCWVEDDDIYACMMRNLGAMNFVRGILLFFLDITFAGMDVRFFTKPCLTMYWQHFCERVML